MATPTQTRPAFVQMARSEFAGRYGWALAELESGTIIEVTDQRTGRVLYLRATRELPAELADVAHLIEPLEPAGELVG